MNYYINEMLVVRSYYRYYTQNQVDYFAPFETHLSTEKYYTSDYYLSQFTANQYSLAVNYTDIFTSFKIAGLGLKDLNLKFSHYNRSDGLSANIFSFGFKFVGVK
jgi:hypothetical protein